MKSASAGTVSGCLVWVILFVVSVPCLVPLMLFFGNFALYTDFSNRAVQPILCPANTTLQVRTYDTTTTDSRHHNVAAVGHDANCVATGGQQVKDVLIEYIFLWRGVEIVAGGILAALLAFLLAAPAGVLVARFMNRTKTTSG